MPIAPKRDYAVAYFVSVDSLATHGLRTGADGHGDRHANGRSSTIAINRAKAYLTEPRAASTIRQSRPHLDRGHGERIVHHTAANIGIQPNHPSGASSHQTTPTIPITNAPCDINHSRAAALQLTRPNK